MDTGHTGTDIHKIDTSVSEVWLGDDGIVREVGHQGAHVTMATARKQLAALAVACAGKRRPMLVDIRAVRSVTREAREALSGLDTEECVSAVAILVGSAMSRVMGNFFIGFNRGLFPTRLFTDESKALGWLGAFINREGSE